MTRTSVARRVFVAFSSLVVALFVTTGVSLHAERQAAEESRLFRSGYLPLMLSLGSLLETQNLVSTQLNHITDARNPGDARGWVDAARKTRPSSFAAVRAAVDRGLLRGGDPRAEELGREITRELGEVERFLDDDAGTLALLFDALREGDRTKADAARDRVLELEIQGARRLRELSRRVERATDELADRAATRGRRAQTIFIVLAALTALTAVLTALYVRRVLAPLRRIRDRAVAVGRGDLEPAPPLDTGDELGELSTTFEQMVSAIAKAREETLRAERLAAVGKLAAQITHEIRNPLSAIGLSVELLEEELGDRAPGDEASQLLGAVKSEVDRLSALSERYLSLARRPTPQRDLVALGGVVSGVAQLARPELQRAGVELVVEVPSDLEIEVDAGQLRQVLVNLLRNAREALARGGHVWIRAARGEGETTTLVVEDDGPGVPDELRDRLFQPFVTTKKDGTGLGLSTTRELVEANGGTIRCEERPGGGARFVLSLE